MKNQDYPPRKWGFNWYLEILFTQLNSSITLLFTAFTLAFHKTIIITTAEIPERITMIAVLLTSWLTFTLIAILTAQPKTWHKKNKNRNKNIWILTMKIKITIIMKNTKVSRDLRCANKQLYTTVAWNYWIQFRFGFLKKACVATRHQECSNIGFSGLCLRSILFRRLFKGQPWDGLFGVRLRCILNEINPLKGALVPTQHSYW